MFFNRQHNKIEKNLFNTRPKHDKKDLFGREKELENLKRSLLSHALTLLVGMRRIGKSSLLHVALNDLKESEGLPLFFDVREIYSVSGTINMGILCNKFENQLINISAEHSLFEKLKEIKGITLGPIGLQFDWKKTELYAVLEKMDKWAGNNGGKIILAFDEAQYFAESETKLQIKALLAHLYDYRQNIKIVLTGSEVVLLYEFIGINDPFSEFYGRYANEISLSPLTEENAKKFLEEGFSYGGVKVSEEVIENAVENLGGTIGWLTKFGAEATEMALKARKAIKDPKEILEILEKIREEAKMQIMKEVERLVKMEGGKQEDYKTVLHLLTKPGYETLEDIKPVFMDKIKPKIFPEGEDIVMLLRSVDSVELENKSPFKKAEKDVEKLVLSILKNLERFSFLKSEQKEKKTFYYFTDLVVKEAAEDLK
jgi:AAA+ ATPase superfamily predicted ATPase